MSEQNVNINIINTYHASLGKVTKYVSIYLSPGTMMNVGITITYSQAIILYTCCHEWEGKGNFIWNIVIPTIIKNAIISSLVIGVLIS